MKRRSITTHGRPASRATAGDWEHAARLLARHLLETPEDAVRFIAGMRDPVCADATLFRCAEVALRKVAEENIARAERGTGPSRWRGFDLDAAVEERATRMFAKEQISA